MDDEKRAEVIELFSQITKGRKLADAPATERRAARASDRGTTIIGSTIVVCGLESLQDVVLKMLEQKKRRRKAV